MHGGHEVLVIGVMAAYMRSHVEAVGSSGSYFVNVPAALESPVSGLPTSGYMRRENARRNSLVPDIKSDFETSLVALEVGSYGQIAEHTLVESIASDTTDTNRVDRRLTAEDGKCKVFTFWDYPNGAPLFVKLNVLSWRRHLPCQELIFINDTNVKAFIPDMPDEYFKMPYIAAKSDLVRYALLYHHGGIYLDTDFLVVKDSAVSMPDVTSADFFAYETGEQSCATGTFSSNFIAGRKGSNIFEKVWHMQKSAIVTHCDSRDNVENKVCCFDDVAAQCHVPWTGLGENISHAMVQTFVNSGTPLIMHCLSSSDEGFVPDWWLYVLERFPKREDAESFYIEKNVTHVFDRAAYHLFNSGSATNLSNASVSVLFDNVTIFGYLYTRSFGSVPTEFGELERVPGIAPRSAGEK